MLIIILKMVNLIGNLASWLCFQLLDACKLLECGRAFSAKLKSPTEVEGIFSLNIAFETQGALV